MSLDHYTLPYMVKSFYVKHCAAGCEAVDVMRFHTSIEYASSLTVKRFLKVFVTAFSVSDFQAYIARRKRTHLKEEYRYIIKKELAA